MTLSTTTGLPAGATPIISASSHQARAVEIVEPADGLLAVRVRCCNDPASDSWLTIHGLDRADEEIDKDIAAHQVKVATLHHHKQRAKEHLARLAK